jgi:hypothetical protein
VIETPVNTCINPYYNNKRTRLNLSDKSNTSNIPVTNSHSNPHKNHYYTQLPTLSYAQVASPFKPTNPHPVTSGQKITQPLKGLGGGLSEFDKKVLQLDEEMKQLKDYLDKTANGVEKLQQDLALQATKIDTKCKIG